MDIDAKDMEALKRDMLRGWSPRTSSDPAGWSRKGPAWGQCAVSALYVQEKLGGSIVRVMYKTPQGLEGSHYFNFVGGQKIDLTLQQFPAQTVFTPSVLDRPLTLLQITQDYVISKGQQDGDVRSYLLSNPDTAARYERMKKNIERFSQVVR